MLLVFLFFVFVTAIWSRERTMASYFQWAGGIFGAQGAQTNPNLQSSGMLSREQLLQLFKEFSDVLDRPGEEFCINVFFKIGFWNVNQFCDVSETRHLKNPDTWNSYYSFSSLISEGYTSHRHSLNCKGIVRVVIHYPRNIVFSLEKLVSYLSNNAFHVCLDRIRYKETYCRCCEG